MNIYQDLNKSEIKKLIKTKLSHQLGVSPEQASDELFYKASVMVVKDLLVDSRKEFIASRENNKRVYYLCMEFLMGRSLKNNLFNMGMEETFAQALSEMGAKLDCIYELEPDAGLGNGGLGRLAACFLDGMASDGIPAMGYSIRYEYGIFKQKIVDGWQTEMPDYWLPGGDVWFNPQPEEAIEVKFDGYIEENWNEGHHQSIHRDYSPVLAIPYDLMVAGYDGQGVSVLRLWKAKAPGFDMKLFNEGNYLKAVEENAMAEVISKVLYPTDNHYEGKSLRLRQQYFLVSASIQDIVKRHLKKCGNIGNLSDSMAIHINDTHPALVIPELMRILLDDCGYAWDDAWEIISKPVAYTNHTVMREALECWPVDIFRQRLPRIYQIVTEIDNRFRKEVWDKTRNAETVERTAVIGDGTIRMANLSIVGSHNVNGVSALHSDILKKTVFSDFYDLDPTKFSNVTNGIACRRWLNQANPKLAEFITSLIGPGYIKNTSELTKLLAYKDDESVLNTLAEIKHHNKERLSNFILKNHDISVDPNMVFDVQAKRLHEYKRQHLNALHILAQYQFIKDNPNAPFTPKAYFFAAKAAPGYFMAKEIIRLIYQIGKMIEADEQTRDKLKVVFLEDYRVTLAELLMPAAEISEQISLAGTEASGTGNMKLMLNGAITVGTEDGANVEIHEAVGDENIIIFGMRTDEAVKTKLTYNPRSYYDNNPVLKNAIHLAKSGVGGQDFSSITSSLLSYDTYMVMGDFEDYCKAQKKAGRLYSDKLIWNGMSLVNIAQAGRFSADRAIDDYARDIWKLNTHRP